MTLEFSIRRATESDAPKLTRLMEREIWWSRLKELGHPFSWLIHRHLIESPQGFCLLAERGCDIVGYGAGTSDHGLFFRGFLRNYGLWATLLVLPRLVRPRFLVTILRGLSYFPKSPASDPKAEMLSFCVASEVKGQGVAQALFRSVTEELAVRGIRHMKFGTVDASNEPAIRFYEKMGLTRVRSTALYRGQLVHVYLYSAEETRAS